MPAGGAGRNDWDTIWSPVFLRGVFGRGSPGERIMGHILFDALCNDWYFGSLTPGSFLDRSPSVEGIQGNSVTVSSTTSVPAEYHNPHTPSLSMKMSSRAAHCTFPLSVLSIWHSKQRAAICQRWELLFKNSPKKCSNLPISTLLVSFIFLLALKEMQMEM